MKNTSLVELSADALLFAHRWILKKVDITETEWATAMFEAGYRVARQFSRMFPDQQEEIETYLVKSPPDPGNSANWYWQWWKFKWMYNDWLFIDQKMYRQPTPYLHWKSYMEMDEWIEMEIMDRMEYHSIISKI